MNPAERCRQTYNPEGGPPFWGGFPQTALAKCAFPAEIEGQGAKPAH